MAEDLTSFILPYLNPLKLPPVTLTGSLIPISKAFQYCLIGHKQMIIPVLCPLFSFGDEKKNWETKNNKCQGGNKKGFKRNLKFFGGCK